MGSRNSQRYGDSTGTYVKTNPLADPSQYIRGSRVLGGFCVGATPNAGETGLFESDSPSEYGNDVPQGQRARVRARDLRIQSRRDG